MKMRIALILSALVIASVIFLYNRHMHNQKPCQCFCAFEQGLRDKRPEDTPFVATLSNSAGNTFDICLCAQRDLDHLMENPELIDNITDEMIHGADCCD